jgi:lysophospholipase L1-like esterase
MAISLPARLGAAAVAVLVSFGICELAARAVFPAPPNSARQPQVAYVYDEELRYVPLASQQGWVDDGLVTINSQGFRGRPAASPKPEGQYRIVFIGDSVTFGRGVNDDETFPARAEALLRERFPHMAVDVINAGVDGYNTRQAVGRLRRLLPDLQPDLVLLGFYSNDVSDAVEGNDSGTRIAGSPQEGRVMYINPSLASSWSARLRQSRAIHAAARGLRRLTGQGEWSLARFTLEMDLLNGRDSAELDHRWAIVADQYEELRQLAADSGFRVGVVILPCQEQVEGQFPNARYQVRVRQIAEPLAFQVIDPLPRLAAQADTGQNLFIAYDRNHPSAAGHRIIADAIVDALGTGLGVPN